MAYAFNAPTLWNFDFSMQMYGAIFMMAGAYTLSTEAHVRGDVIYRLFKPRTQGYIDFILYFIFCFKAWLLHLKIKCRQLIMM
jgi:TRAP-type mannitol/chloroaromatic compound transport system permease small subunit